MENLCDGGVSLGLKGKFYGSYMAGMHMLRKRDQYRKIKKIRNIRGNLDAYVKKIVNGRLNTMEMQLRRPHKASCPHKCILCFKWRR